MTNPEKLTRIILFSTLLMGCNPPPSNTSTVNAPPETTTHTVIRVGDGDTLNVKSPDGTSIKVRVGCIDTPESSQEYGPEAGQRLKTLLPSGATIELREIDTDQYGRTVAEIYAEGKSVGLQLVQEGYAVVYQRYLDGCSATADQYVAAEEQARLQRLNFWSQNNPVMPWDYRRGRGMLRFTLSTLIFPHLDKADNNVIIFAGFVNIFDSSRGI